MVRGPSSSSGGGGHLENDNNNTTIAYALPAMAVKCPNVFENVELIKKRPVILRQLFDMSL